MGVCLVCLAQLCSSYVAETTNQFIDLFSTMKLFTKHFTSLRPCDSKLSIFWVVDKIFKFSGIL